MIVQHTKPTQWLVLNFTPEINNSFIKFNEPLTPWIRVTLIFLMMTNFLL